MAERLGKGSQGKEVNSHARLTDLRKYIPETSQKAGMHKIERYSLHPWLGNTMEKTSVGFQLRSSPNYRICVRFHPLRSYFVKNFWCKTSLFHRRRPAVCFGSLFSLPHQSIRDFLCRVCRCHTVSASVKGRSCSTTGFWTSSCTCFVHFSFPYLH